jgi:hypothetical protein
MTNRVYITSNNLATFSCPTCRKSKTVDMAKHSRIEKAVNIRVKCICGHIYPVTLERRKQFRRHTDLPGTFYLMAGDSRTVKGSMVVLDVSRTGLKFKIHGEHRMVEGDRLRVEFHLDDKNNSLIEKEVIIRKITGSEIGSEFSSVDPSDINDRTIGFYLMG